MVDLPVQRPSGRSVQLDRRHEKFQAAFQIWLREVVLFIVRFFGQNGDGQEEQNT
jgi:hypothetical protein